jgi:hypothetical protein
VVTADDFRDEAEALGYPTPSHVFDALGGTLRWEAYPTHQLLADCQQLGYPSLEAAIAVLRRHARQALSAFVISD